MRPPLETVGSFEFLDGRGQRVAVRVDLDRSRLEALARHAVNRIRGRRPTTTRAGGALHIEIVSDEGAVPDAVPEPKRPLGSVQESVLAALKQHKLWHAGCGWLWSTPSETDKIMRSLVRAGVATVEKAKDSARPTYRPKEGAR